MLNPNEAGAEGSNSQIASFDTDGWTFNSSDNGINGSGQTYVGWSWKAGGTGSTNTAGTITSTVSVSPSAGFSIVSYTGNNTAGATVGHGLGVAPNMVIVKNRTDVDNWKVYHSALGNTKGLDLNRSAGFALQTELWNDTSPTSTVFSLGTNNALNGSSDDMIAYCFAEVEGYSKFGSYTGNGSTDGPFVYCGFRPAWIMYKKSSGTGNWIIHDTTRSEYNVTTNRLFANLSNAEGTSTTVSWDLLSNGAKIRTSDAGVNGSGNTFVFMAFAENPFGGTGVSPATAR
jgi:hypothetical protein